MCMELKSGICPFSTFALLFIIYLSIIVHVGLKPLIRLSLPESLVLSFPVQLP